MLEYLMETVMDALFKEDDLFIIPQRESEIVVTNRETLEMWIIKVFPSEAFAVNRKPDA